MGNIIIKLPWKLEREAPPFEGNDIKFPESLARHYLKRFTKKGDAVLDPFTGLGTTLFIAEEMKRNPFGFEADEQKHQWVAGQMKNWTQCIHDDAGNINKYKLPKMDCILTSPPYMPRHHKWHPLYGGNPKYNGYDKYLKRTETIFGDFSSNLKKNGTMIVQIDNLLHKNIFTPLIHDVQHAISKNFDQIEENIVLWDNPKSDYPSTTCMVFKKK